MGLAWQVQDKDPSQPRLFSKNGGTGRGGYSCWIGFMPERGIGLSILTNEFSTGRGLSEEFAPEEPGPRNPTALGMRMIRRLARSAAPRPNPFPGQGLVRESESKPQT